MKKIYIHNVNNHICNVLKRLRFKQKRYVRKSLSLNINLFVTFYDLWGLYRIGVLIIEIFIKISWLINECVKKSSSKILELRNHAVFLWDVEGLTFLTNNLIVYHNLFAFLVHQYFFRRLRNCSLKRLFMRLFYNIHISQNKIFVKITIFMF